MSTSTVFLTNTASGTVLDLSDSGSADGTPIIGWHKHGGKNQQWKLIKVGDRGIWPIYKIQNVATGTYVDLLNGNSSDGTAVNGWSGSKDAGNNHQNWQIMSDVSGELVKIQNVGTGTFLDMMNGNSKDGTKVTGWSGPIGLDDAKDTHRVWKVLKV